MKTIAVDTSVLLAIMKGEAEGNRWLECLLTAAENGILVVSSVVLAEFRSHFSSDKECQETMRDLHLRHTPLTEEAALLGGKIFRAYRREGGPRTTILPDFMIAAHAATQADLLATEDRGYLREYFPKLRFLQPA